MRENRNGTTDVYIYEDGTEWRVADNWRISALSWIGTAAEFITGFPREEQKKSIMSCIFIWRGAVSLQRRAVLL